MLTKQMLQNLPEPYVYRCANEWCAVGWASARDTRWMRDLEKYYCISCASKHAPKEIGPSLADVLRWQEEYRGEKSQ